MEQVLSLSEEALDLVQKAKAAGHDVFQIKIASMLFVYRPVYRQEWKQLLKHRNKAMLAAADDPIKKVDVAEEEMEKLLEICLVYPKTSLDTMPAGCIQALCDAITEASGFSGVEVESIKL